MNIGILAFGHGGCSIANKLQQLDRNTTEDLVTYAVGFDTDAQHIASHDNLTSTVLFAQTRFNGEGSGVDIEPVVEETWDIKNYIIQAAEQVHKKNIDAFLLIGSLGGGTGGGSTAVAAQILAQRYPEKPLYTVGILPSTREPDTMTLNASRAIQSWVANTDNVILFDNDELEVGIPSLIQNEEFKQSIKGKENKTGPDIFTAVNEDIARILHFTFTADDRQETTDDDAIAEFVPDKNKLTSTLSCGGLSTLTYTSDTLPKSQWPGITGSIYGFINSIQTASETELDEVQSNKEQSVQKTDRHHSPLDTSTHPSDLLPIIFTDQAITAGINPRICTDSYTLLIGREKLFNTSDIEITTEWITDAVNAKTVDTGFYPIETNEIATIHISAGIGLQPRIQQLHQDASIIAERIIHKQSTTRDAKNKDPFNSMSTSVPPVL